ncbi:hypothetical protein [Enterobacter roggenkampii]|uniref:hypothetical protein n=1 Tax=Enterobacter roggenkampii TaxID=1812935 RepID=UPI002005AA6E|nr:hypothetical protein [Enterobacter roggenkampii]MCK6977438.1 hypothetical protein [Enterobacter roggenkampii]
MFWKIMNRMEGVKIFINDEENGWYVHGIPGMGVDVLSSSSHLMTMIKEIAPKEVVLVGPSMGAYAAMLYGSIISPRMPEIRFRCLSFGGEFLLYGRETKSKSLAGKPRNLWYADIRSILATSGLEVTHVYGDDDVNDIFQASLVHGMENVRLVSVRNAPHAVSTYLGQNYNLTNIIKSYEQNGCFEIECESDISKLKGHGALLYHGHILMLDKKPTEALEKLRKAVLLAPTHALSHHKYGLALIMERQESLALHHQEKAISLNPSLAHAHFHIAQISQGMGNVEKALSHYADCIMIDEHHVRALFEISKLKQSIGDYESAKKHANSILGIDPANVRAKALIKELESIAPPR